MSPNSHFLLRTVIFPFRSCQLHREDGTVPDILACLPLAVYTLYPAAVTLH